MTTHNGIIYIKINMENPPMIGVKWCVLYLHDSNVSDAKHEKKRSEMKRYAELKEIREKRKKAHNVVSLYYHFGKRIRYIEIEILKMLSAYFGDVPHLHHQEGVCCLPLDFYFSFHSASKILLLLFSPFPHFSLYLGLARADVWACVRALMRALIRHSRIHFIAWHGMLLVCHILIFMWSDRGLSFACALHSVDSWSSDGSRFTWMSVCVYYIYRNYHEYHFGLPTLFSCVMSFVHSFASFVCCFKLVNLMTMVMMMKM